jgi:hypothetical protein
LVTVTVWYSDVVFSTVEAKVRLVVLSVTVGFAVPVPLSAAVCGLPAALSATLNDAASTPAEAGLKATVTTQLAAAASVAPQSFSSKYDEALVPVSVIELRLAVAVPVFFTVIVCAALVTPATVFGKVTVVGVSVIAGARAVTVTVTIVEVEAG